MASTVLINENTFQAYWHENEINLKNVKSFAESQNVQPFIIIGRLQRETNDYTLLAKYKTRYKWLED